MYSCNSCEKGLFLGDDETELLGNDSTNSEHNDSNIQHGFFGEEEVAFVPAALDVDPIA